MKRKAKTSWIYSLALVVFALGVPMTSFAATQVASSNIYLDSHDNVIGQQVRFCDSHAYHAGQINTNNPYMITLTKTCPSTTFDCTGTTCSPNPETTMQVSFFRSATGKTVTYFCDQPHPVGTAFYGTDGQCGASAPIEISILGAFSNGWSN